jgi:hypothetical protein
MAWAVGKYYIVPRTLFRILQDNCSEIGCELFRAFNSGQRGSLADFFIGKLNSQQNQPADLQSYW